MCVIIVRKPGVVLPIEMIESACIVNADGFGMSVMDRGKMVTVRGYEDGKGNDPHKIMKLLEDAKDMPVYLHLRYRTAGNKSVENTHPFEVLNKKDHGIDVMMMHNGTLSDFKDAATPDDADTKIFIRQIVTPLMANFFCTMNEKELMENPTINQILKTYAGYNSKFVLFNQNGDDLFINRDKGTDHEGWWASNDYSFNRSHRTPAHSNSNWYYGQSHNNNNSGGASNSKNANSGGSNGSGSGTSVAKYTTNKDSNSSPLPNSSGTGKQSPIRSFLPAICESTENAAARAAGLAKEAENVKKMVPSMIKASNTPKFAEVEKRDTFCSLVNVGGLHDICNLESDDIRDIVENFPDMATLWILDLCNELYKDRIALLNKAKETAPKLVDSTGQAITSSVYDNKTNAIITSVH